MKWPWSRRNEPTEPGEPEEVGADPLPFPDWGLEEHIIATSAVMEVRDAVQVFLNIIRNHRSDDHECPPYCVPTEMAYFLGLMDDHDLRRMLTVVLKDMIENYLRHEAHE